MKTFTSPQNRFTVGIPADWEFEAYAPDESSVGFHPAGRETPKVDIALTEASILALQMGLQAFGYQPARSPMAARDFLNGVFLPALRQKMPDLMIESLASSDQRTAESVISGSYEGKRGTAKIVAMMEHLQDPSVGSWYNFALLHILTTAPSELNDPSLDVIASDIFRSFKPTSRWGAEMFQAIAQGIQTRYGIISRTISRINAMEMRQRMAEMQSNTRIGQGWMDALGGTTVVTNPSSGDAWRVSNQNKYYYEQAGQVYGTDDYADLNIVGRTPLEQR